MTTDKCLEAGVFNDYSLIRLARERQQELYNDADLGGATSGGRPQRRSDRWIMTLLARIEPGVISRAKSRQPRSGLRPEADVR
jgi:hypothetical protein